MNYCHQPPAILRARPHRRRSTTSRRQAARETPRSGFAIGHAAARLYLSPAASSGTCTGRQSRRLGRPHYQTSSPVIGKPPWMQETRAHARSATGQTRRHQYRLTQGSRAKAVVADPPVPMQAAPPREPRRRGHATSMASQSPNQPAVFKAV
ncbi:hypothetical protein U9M48_009548 [Paspalum notatum var. saurae]|uniref:Uncharacterized protein n=1 Tax=Paspalum notatum var. saurae TaxID=547442 RepID=A0AAQ3SSV7_PASNO